MSKKKVVDDDVLGWIGKTSQDAGREAPAEKVSPVRRFTLHLPADLIETLRRAAWWDRVTIRSIVETGLATHMDNLEQQRGSAYPPKQGEHEERAIA